MYNTALLIYMFLTLPVIGNSFISSPPIPPIAKTSKGQLKGRWFVTRGGRFVAGFLGIPYAAPPIGPLRFKSPQAPDPWVGVRDASKDAPGCIQKMCNVSNPLCPAEISEDCLYLNVYSLDIHMKFPVVIYIYEGGFETGAAVSETFGPDYLLDEEVVLVIFNYRLGPLGFMSLEDPVLPGNLGLKDQRAAFRWVRDNIAHFGGDPHKVTIFGQSSGAASVHYHLIFTVKEGLFRAGIADSGSAWDTFAFQPPGAQAPLVERVRNMTGCPAGSQALLDCLRRIPAYEFEIIRQELQKTDLPVKFHVPVFAPVAEPYCVADALILTDPWNTTMGVPVLQGSNQYDGLRYTEGYETDKSDGMFRELDDHYENVLPFNLFLNERAQQPEKVGRMLKEFYFGKNKIDREHYLDLVRLFSDGRYNYGIVVAARRNLAKTYFYQMNYKGSNSIVHYFGSKEYYGVSHEDELFYLFPFGGIEKRNITVSDTIFSKEMVKMWTNFVKYMDPTPDQRPSYWQPVVTPAIEYLDIGQHTYIMRSGFLKHRMDFWDRLPFRDKQQRGRPTCGKSWQDYTKKAIQALPLGLTEMRLIND